MWYNKVRFAAICNGLKWSIYHSSCPDLVSLMTLSISSWHFRWYSGFSAKEYRIQEMALAVVSWPETTNQSNTVNYSGICFQISLAFCNLLLSERFWLGFFLFLFLFRCTFEHECVHFTPNVLFWHSFSVLIFSCQQDV